MGKRNDPITAADPFGEWYLTVRCPSVECGELIAFQKTVYRGNQLNLRFALTGEPTVHCPRCGMLTPIHVDQIERRRIVLTH